MEPSSETVLSPEAAMRLAGLIIRNIALATAAAVLVAYWARQRGYHWFAWFIAAFLANAGVIVCFLAALPDRRLQTRRAQLRAWLDHDLARKKNNASATRGSPGVGT